MGPRWETVRFAWPVAVLVLSGCAGSPPEEPDRRDGEGAQAEAFELVLYLADGRRLVPDAPVKTSPDRVAANPTANAFANEDLDAFASTPVLRQLLVESARLVVYYASDAPVADPFLNQSDPQEGRRFVFWVGSRDVYPASATVVGEPFLVPDRVYQAELDFELPRGGWLVPAGEGIELLEATLLGSSEDNPVWFLTNSTGTPSRVELRGKLSSEPLPASLYAGARTVRILGNSGLFTGATAEAADSRFAMPIEVDPGDAYLEVQVRWLSTRGGKSDLDLEVFAPSGGVAGASATPFQNETVRLFAPNLAAEGPGTYQARVTAYSGVDTEFELRILGDRPR